MQFIQENKFSLCGLACLGLWYVACLLFTPVTPVFVNEWAPVYLPAVYVLSLLCLAVPAVLYVCSNDFRELKWYRQILLVSVALMLTALVHRPRVYLDVQIVFWLCAFVALVADKQRRVNRPPLFYYVFWLYFIWQAVTILWTNNTTEAKIYFNRLVPLFSYSLAFLFVWIEKQQYKALVLLFWRVVCIGCLLTLASLFYEAERMGVSLATFLPFGKYAINGIPVYDIIFAWSGAPHPTYNALWIIAGLICSFYLLDLKRLTLFEAAVSWVLIFAVIYISQSRVGLVTYGVSAAFGVLYLLRRERKLLWSVTGALVVVAGIMVVTHIETLRSFAADPVRDGLVRVATDYLRIDPWKGCGLGGMTYDYVSSVVGYEFKSWWPQFDYVSFYPHNQFLGDWMQSGIAGLVLLCAVVVSLFYESIRQRNFIAFVYFLVVLVIMQIEMPFHILSGTTIIAFLSCFFLCRQTPSER